MNDIGEPTADDIEALKKTRDCLIEKRNELLKRRNFLSESMIEYNNKIDMELKQYQSQKDEVDKVTKIYENLPAHESIHKINELQNKKKELEETLCSLKTQVKAQLEEKELLLAQIYGKSPTKVWKKSLSFLHQSLMDELSEMVKLNYAPEILLKKEQQIRYCENLSQ